MSWLLNVDYWMLITEWVDYWMSWLLNELITEWVDYWMLITECWLLNVDYWMLITECWFLNVDYWMSFMFILKFFCFELLLYNFGCMCKNNLTFSKLKGGSTYLFVKGWFNVSFWSTQQQNLNRINWTLFIIRRVKIVNV